MLGSYIIHGMYPRYELLAFAYESGLKLRDSGGITDIWEWPNIKHLYAKNNTLIIVDKNNIVAHCGLAKKYGEGISKTLKRIYELWEQHLFSKSEITLFEYPKYELPKETTLLSLILRTPPVLKFIYLFIVIISLVSPSVLFLLLFLFLIQVITPIQEYRNNRLRNVQLLKFEGDNILIIHTNGIEKNLSIQTGRAQIHETHKSVDLVTDEEIIYSIDRFSYYPILKRKLMGIDNRKNSKHVPI